MKLFSCDICQQVIFFENQSCGVCDKRLGYDATTNAFITLDPSDDGFWRDASGRVPGTLRLCENQAHNVCNWLCDDGSDATFCIACRHNKIIPDLSVEGNQERWQKLELAKHRLFYTILRLGLPVQTRLENPTDGLEFDFMGDPSGGDGVLTGHSDGVITIALREADDVEREKMRVEMGEYYRALLGHFRHEVGHYFWNVLVRDAGRLEACRAVFGDETRDYQQALAEHYENQHTLAWQGDFVSAYAAAHPWEDFAESWAHYLHIVDAIETAWSYGMTLQAKVASPAVLTARMDFDPCLPGPFEQMRDVWFPLASVETALNRSMGLGDFYPFILSDTILKKLGFIHELVHGEVIAAPD